MRIPISESEKGIVTKYTHRWEEDKYTFHSYQTIPDHSIVYYKGAWYKEMTFSEFKKEYPYPTNNIKVRFKESTKHYKTYYEK